MRWNDEEYTTGKPVVRMLSFCKKTEDGDIIDVATSSRPHSESTSSSSDIRRTSNEFGSCKSLTSIDVKKSRRTSSTLQRNPPPTKPPSVLKSNSFSTKEPTKYEQLNARALRNGENSAAVEKPNKLILRVPSAAHEHENKKVFYSVCGEEDEGDEFEAEKRNTICNVNEPKLEIANQKNLNSSSNGIASGGVSVISNLIDSNVPYLGVDKEEAIKNLISCENSNSTTGSRWDKSKSTTNLIVTPKSKPIFRRKDFSMKNGTINSFSSEFGLDLQERWRIPVTDPSHNSSDVGSTSLSNFSSGDGLSTPSHMGSTSRLIYQKKTKKRWKCGFVENFSTLMSILAFAGSLANVVRLPRMVHFHGGGTFLLIYTILTLLFGIPLAFLEIGLGQFCQHGTVKIWRAVTLFKGIGYTKVLISFFMSVYYAIYIAVAGSLLIWDLKEPLPLSKCFVPAQLINSTTGPTVPERNKDCSLLNFWSSISEDPSWFWINIICLFLIWSLLIVCVLKRSKSFRKTIYVTLTTTIVLLIILIVEASTRSTEGISKLLIIRWSKFFDVQVWYFTITQMFMSTQIGFGNITTSAGRLFPKTNAFWSALALIFGNLILGYMSVSLVYLWIGQIEEAGFSLSPSNVTELFVFDIIYNMSVGSVSQWASVIGILGYVMVICAGITSAMILTYSTLVAIAIEAKKKWHWWHITVILCLFAFFVGIATMIPANLSIPHVLEHYVITPSVLGLTCLEIVGFAYFYGMKNLYQDFEFVVGTKMGNYWKIMWFLTPIVLIIIASCSISMLSLKGESPIQDDTWEYSLGWSLYLITWFIVIITAFYQIYKQVDYNLPQKFLSSIKPSRNWGPVDPIYRHCWVQWRNRYQMTGRGDFSLKRRGTRDYTLSVRSHGSLVDCSRGINPSNDWTYARSISSGPYHLHNDGNHHICWRKDENF